MKTYKKLELLHISDEGYQNKYRYYIFNLLKYIISCKGSNSYPMSKKCILSDVNDVEE